MPDIYSFIVGNLTTPSSVSAESNSTAKASGQTGKLVNNHKVTASTKSASVAKTLGKAAIIGASILLAPAIGIYLAYEKVRKLQLKPESVENKVTEHKKTEETRKFQAMQKVLKDFNPSGGVKKIDDAIQGLEHKLQDKKALYDQKVERHLFNAFGRKGVFLKDNEKEHLRLIIKHAQIDENSHTPLQDALLNAAIQLAFDDDQKGKDAAKFCLDHFGKSQGNKKLSHADLNNIKASIDKELSATSAPKESAKELKAHLHNLAKIVSEDPSKNPVAHNRKFILELRSALKSPAYQALKHDPTDPSVRLLHKWATAIWNEVRVVDSYKELGQSIQQETDQRIAKNSKQSKGHSVDVESNKAEYVKESQKALSKVLHTDHGIGKLSYGLAHADQAVGSLASEGGQPRAIAGFFNEEVYDPHAKLSNNPSLQGTTTLAMQGGGNVKVNNCYGGSPTIGDDEITPEFHAAIQAAENNQFADVHDDSIPDIVYYTNFQDLDKKHGESPRSKTIMNLNQQYPLAFKGITLSKDSEFYLSSSHKKHPERTSSWPGAKAFGEQMKAQMQKGVSNDPSNSVKQGHGFYFPGDKAGKEWETAFDAAIEQANAHFAEFKDSINDPPLTEKEFSNLSDDKKKEVKGHGQEAYELRGAYQEYVYSMMQAYMEAKLGQDLMARGVKNPSVMAIRACKENIDRGGAENAKYLYLRLPQDMDANERNNIMLGALHGRSLGMKERVILSKRLPQVLAFMGRVSPQQFQRGQEAMLQKLGVQGPMKYQVAMTPS